MSKDPEKKIRKKRKGRKIRKLIIAVLLLAVLGLAVWIGYNKLRAEYRVTYEPYTATTGSISNSLSYSGSMQLVNSTTYTADENGTVKEVLVKNGDKVTKGQTLIRMKGGDKIEAEFDGEVAKLSVEAGDEVKNGDTLVNVTDNDNMKLTFRVGESDISTVLAGQACKVTVSSAGETFESVIDNIDYLSYSGNNVAYYTATVYVDVSGSKSRILGGMQATISIPLEEANNVIVLKMDGLSTARDNTAYVYKQAEDGTMTETPVTVGVSNGNYVEIKEGISDGETVYKIAAKTEEDTGLGGLLSGLFGSQQVNAPSGMPGGMNFGGGDGAGFSFGSGGSDEGFGGSGGGSSRPSGTGGGSGGSGRPGGQ